jgi:hypothetical protein
MSDEVWTKVEGGIASAVGRTDTLSVPHLTIRICVDEWNGRHKAADIDEAGLATLNRLFAEIPRGTFACPHCGKDTPHQHSVDRKGVVSAVPQKGVEE